MPQYCLVKHRIENVTIDGDDPDRNPDRSPVTGMVTFTPLLGKGDAVVITENGQKTTLTLSPIEARITNGELWHRGEPGVKLFAGGPDTNPERIRYRAKFENLIGGGRKVELKDILFEAVPGGELSLAVAQPVPGAPYPGYSVTIEAGIAEISDVAVSYLELIESARDESLGQVEGAVDAELDRVFGDPSTNLFDKSKVTEKTVMPKGAAEPVYSDNMNISDPIPVTAGETYSYAGLLRITYLDSSGGYVWDVSLPATWAGTYTVPTGATHARLSVTFHDGMMDIAQMNLGPELLPYEPGGYGEISADYLPQNLWFTVEPDDIGAQPAGDYLEGPVTPDMTTFFVASTNLFDKSKVTEKMVLSSGSATPTASENYNVSDFIPVTEGETYSYTGMLRITYLASDGTYVGKYDSPTVDWAGSRTALPGATHVRLSVDRHNGSMDIAQMNLGDTLLPYEPGGGPKIPPRYLPEITIPTEPEQPEQPEQPATPEDYVPFIISEPEGLAEYYQAPLIESQASLAQATPETVYGWWDQLMADHPDYVTRRELGMACDGVTPMYSYTLRPESVPTTHTGETQHEERFPKVLLISGVHAFEETGIYNVWRIAKALCDEWDTHPGLQAIRWNIEIVCIPVGNPTGLLATPHTRQNANGVDIARNFEAGWRLNENPGTYSGLEPLSEPETQHITQVMEEVSADAIFGFSHHMLGASTDNPWLMIWQAAPDEYARILGKRLIARMSTRWRQDYDWITLPDTYFGYVDHLHRPGGGEARALLAHGIPGSVFETSVRTYLDGENPAYYSARAMTLGYESAMNYLLMGIYEGLKVG